MYTYTFCIALFDTKAISTFLTYWSHRKWTKYADIYFSGCSSGILDKKLPQEIPLHVGVFTVLQNSSDFTVYYL